MPLVISGPLAPPKSIEVAIGLPRGGAGFHMSYHPYQIQEGCLLGPTEVFIEDACLLCLPDACRLGLPEIEILTAAHVL